MFAVLSSTATTATNVSDNLGLGTIIRFLGIGKEDNTPENYSGSLVERINYLEQHMATKDEISRLDQKMVTKDEVSNLSQRMVTKDEISSIDQKISNIKTTTDLQAETVVNTYLQQFKSGGYLAIRDYSSSAAIQEAMATSSIVINSDRSGVALDWLIDNGRPLHDFFDKLNGFNYKVPDNYSIEDFIRDDNCWNHLRNAQYKAFVLNFSANMYRASALDSRSTVYTGELESDYVLHNVFVMTLSYTGMLVGWNGGDTLSEFQTVNYTDVVGNTTQLIGVYDAWSSQHPRTLNFDVYKAVSRFYAVRNTYNDTYDSSYPYNRDAKITIKYVTL